MFRPTARPTTTLKDEPWTFEAEAKAFIQTARAETEIESTAVTRGKNRPGPIMQNVTLLEESDLELDDFVLRQTEVHSLGVLEVEGAFMKLRDRLISVQHRRLLVHLPYHLSHPTCTPQ